MLLGTSFSLLLSSGGRHRLFFRLAPLRYQDHRGCILVPPAGRVMNVPPQMQVARIVEPRGDRLSLGAVLAVDEVLLQVVAICFPHSGSFFPAHLLHELVMGHELQGAERQPLDPLPGLR